MMELELLRKLKANVDQAIAILESGQVLKDSKSDPSPFDFTVGEFGVSILIVDDWEGSYMPKIDGKSFRCGCGCNVFQKSKTNRNRYKCNACDMVYEAT